MVPVLSIYGAFVIATPLLPDILPQGNTKVYQKSKLFNENVISGNSEVSFMVGMRKKWLNYKAHP